MSPPKSTFPKGPRWLLSFYYVVVFVAAIAFAVGVYYSGQIPVRGDVSPSAERPYRAWKGKGGGKDYYLSRSDYFLCQQLAFFGFLGMAVPAVAFGIYTRYVARHASTIENAA